MGSDTHNPSVNPKPANEVDYFSATKGRPAPRARRPPHTCAGLTSAELPFLDPKLEAWTESTLFPTHCHLPAAPLPNDRQPAPKCPGCRLACPSARPVPSGRSQTHFPPPTVLFPSPSSSPQEIPSELHSGRAERPFPKPGTPSPNGRAPAPSLQAAANPGDPRPAPHLLLALAAETQARGPLLVAVAVIGTGLIRLELHHPQGPGGGAVRVVGVEGGEPAPDGRARARPRLGQGKQGGGAAYPLRALPLVCHGLILPVPGPALPLPSRLPSPLPPRPPPPLPPPPPTTTAPPSWARCVSGVKPRGPAGRPRARSAGCVRESGPPSPRGVTNVSPGPSDSS